MTQSTSLKIGIFIAVLIIVLPVIYVIRSFIPSRVMSDLCNCSSKSDCTVYVLVEASDKSRVWVDTFVSCGKTKSNSMMEFDLEQTSNGR